MYTKKTDHRGRVLYRYNGKLIAQRNIPDGVVVQDLDMSELEEMVDQVNRQDATIPVEPVDNNPGRICVVCGEPGTSTRFVNLKTVWLCEDDYMERTLGEIVQAVREKETA